MKHGTVHPHEVPEVHQITSRLCRLQQEVWSAISDGLDAADCFCGEGGFWPLNDPRDFRNEQKALEFIEAATRAALRNRKAVQA